MKLLCGDTDDCNYQSFASVARAAYSISPFVIAALGSAALITA
jgi:hypothetical protein